MTHLGFFPYHNKHIEFKLISGETQSGVVVDTLSMSEKMVDTWYAFVPTAHLAKWQKAEEANDVVTMKKYERVIDINRIVGVRLIPAQDYKAVS